MKKIKILFKKRIGEIFILLGTGLFTYNILNFSYKTSTGCLLGLTCSEIKGVAYFYSDKTLSFITVGIILLILGILIIKNNY